MKRKPVSNRDRIYTIVQRIPKGQVATYGQVARLAGLGRQARQVGYALHALPSGSKIPWHRVINARGQISLRSEGGAEITQRILLEREGVSFKGDRIALERYRWKGD